MVRWVEDYGLEDGRDRDKRDDADNVRLLPGLFFFFFSLSHTLSMVMP